MRFLSLILCVCACTSFTSCKTTRTVLAGPTKISSGNGNNYNADREAKTRAAGQAAAASGVVGQFGQGDADFQERFGAFDPGGYMRKDEKGNDVYGLNSMSQKNFGGDLNTKDMKSFSQTRDFLTKKYDTRGELYQKNSSANGVKAWFGNKKANVDKEARETGAQYGGNSRVLDNKMSSSDGRKVDTRDARENGRTASSATKDFYPAKKVLDQGRDEPKIIGQGSKEQNDSVWKLIKSRPRDNPASVEDVRSLLGKTN